MKRRGVVNEEVCGSNFAFLALQRMDELLSIEEAFGELKDPRSRTPALDLTEMLVMAL